MSETTQIQWKEEPVRETNSVFIKLKPLTEEQESKGYYRTLQVGSAIEGVLESVSFNKFGKEEYKLTALDGGPSLVITNAGNLKARMTGENISIGSAVRITYKGMNTPKTGKFAGKPLHTFTVQGEDTAA